MWLCLVCGWWHVLLNIGFQSNLRFNSFQHFLLLTQDWYLYACTTNTWVEYELSHVFSSARSIQPNIIKVSVCLSYKLTGYCLYSLLIYFGARECCLHSKAIDDIVLSEHRHSACRFLTLFYRKPWRLETEHFSILKTGSVITNVAPHRLIFLLIITCNFYVGK